MATLEFKGKFHAVYPVELVGEKQMKKQLVYFQVPGYRDGFGEQKGDDEIWQMAVLGDNVDKLNITEALVGKAATVKLYLNSNMVQKTDKTGFIYPINATLAKFDLKP